jgi:NAD dependent epimerase/dehydratase family
MLLDALAGVDAVIHLAAQNPYPDASWEDASASFDMTAKLVDTCAKASVSRLVFASSNHVMGGYKDTPVAPRMGAFPPTCRRSLERESELAPANAERNRGEGPGLRAMWHSNGDLIQCVLAALRAQASAWPSQAIVVNAMSANRPSPWDLSAGRKLIGY